VGLADVTVPFTAPKYTEFVDGVVLKFIPLMVTEVPTGPDKGVKELIDGNITKPLRLPLPLGPVTFIAPEYPIPFTAVIVLSFKTVNEVAGRPPKSTAVAPVKFCPLIVMMVPGKAKVGENDVMTGPVYVNPDKLPEPKAVVTDTFPDVPGPTTAEILLSDKTVKEVAGIPPNHAIVAPVKFEPLIIMVAPCAPEVGEKDVIRGPVKVKPARLPVPEGVVTDTAPDEPDPTNAVICVGEFTE
jgi:hypothetical protein